MSLDILFRDDIKRILEAAEQASLASAIRAEALTVNVEALRAYRRGFRAALSVVALACGLRPLPPQLEGDAVAASMGMGAPSSKQGHSGLTV
mgnify:CR=1 FL=1